MHAWRRLPSFRGNSKFSTWLHRIAINECLRELSRNRRERLLPPDDMAFAGGSEPEALVDLIVVHEIVRVFVRCVSELPGRYRGPVLLCDVAGLSNRDGASALGLHLANFKTRLHRGRAIVSREMREISLVRRDAPSQARSSSVPS